MSIQILCVTVAFNFRTRGKMLRNRSSVSILSLVFEQLSSYIVWPRGGILTVHAHSHLAHYMRLTPRPLMFRLITGEDGMITGRAKFCSRFVKIHSEDCNYAQNATLCNQIVVFKGYPRKAFMVGTPLSFLDISRRRKLTHSNKHTHWHHVSNTAGV